MEENSLIKNTDIYWKGILKGVAKHQNKLQPIFEAFTNAMEAIFLRPAPVDGNGRIATTLKYSGDLFSETSQLLGIKVEDNGVGFDKENFDRLCRYKDTRKGFNNRGSGRLQYLHYFDETNITSTYTDEDGTLKEISFTLSKAPTFVDNDSIIRFHNIRPATETAPKTVLTFSGLLDERDQNFYRELTLENLKSAILSRYVLLFCIRGEAIPEIIFQRANAQDEVVEQILLQQAEIPQIDSTREFHVAYSNISEDLKRVERRNDSEPFQIQAYKIPGGQLERNEIKLTSKSEVVDGANIKLLNLGQDDHIDGNRFLFLVSSTFIDDYDVDTRGEFELLNRTDYKKKAKEIGTAEPEILIDDIEEGANDTILVMYDEIRQKEAEHQGEIERLKSMFLLNDSTIDSLKFSINDTEEKILEKVYQADAKIMADGDAELKRQIEQIEELNPADADYRTKLNAQVAEFVKQIPLQNRTSLTQYVARRKLVLKLFGKVLERMGDPAHGINEEVFHNLLFQQHSTDSANSDLWMINEDFVYFKGNSEQMLSQVEIDGVKVFKEELDEAEAEYIRSLGENRYSKRPDVLLFPAEAKCIIIEFKKHDANLADHLTQINKYAGLIHNFCKDEMPINTFYGYLIGEAINYQEVQQLVPEFLYNYKFDFLFRPNFNVLGHISGREAGSMYTEVIKYSTLLERAQLRNSIFIDKLTDGIAEAIEEETVVTETVEQVRIVSNEEEV